MDDILTIIARLNDVLLLQEKLSGQYAFDEPTAQAWADLYYLTKHHYARDVGRLLKLLAEKDRELEELKNHDLP